jgi:hypothetical protein
MSMGDLSSFVELRDLFLQLFVVLLVEVIFVFKFIPRYLIFLEAIVNEIAFLYSFLIFSSLVYRKATDFFNLISVSCYIAEAVYWIFVPYSPSYTLSIYPHPSHWYQPPRLECKWEH